MSVLRTQKVFYLAILLIALATPVGAEKKVPAKKTKVGNAEGQVDILQALKDKMNGLEEKNKKLAQEKEEGLAASKKLQEEIGKLEADKEKLGKDFARAIQGIKELKAGKTALLKETKEHEELKEKLKAEKSGLQEEIVRLQNELVLRETEIKILSGDPSAKRELEKLRGQASVQAAAPTTRSQAQQQPVKKEQAIESDITIVEVIADKVNIRSGAGTEHSPIMQVQRGTRLTVEAREGAWYRVFTPTGARGYIQVSVVRQAQAKTPAKRVANLTENTESQGLGREGLQPGLVPFDEAGASAPQMQAPASQQGGQAGGDIEQRALDRLRSNFR